MARINLLPWREAERKRLLQEFAIAAGAALAVTVLLGLGVHFLIEGMIASQQDRNRYLETEIAALDRQIKKIEEIDATKASLVSRMEVIQALQESRPEVVHLFDELVTVVPDGVYLTKVEQAGRSVTLEGWAQSNARVSSFMRNIEASAWVGNPSLKFIENKDQTGGRASRFQLRFDQRQVGGGDSLEAGGPKPVPGKTAKPRKPSAPGKTAKPHKPS